MVCLGNICRSPLAEGLLKSKLDPANFIVESAGTGPWHVGKSPDPRSVEVAKKNGIDISNQRGMQFKSDFFDTYDHIFVMDNSNLVDVLEMATTQEDKDKVKLILNEIFPDENVDVPDPYYGGDDGFDKVFSMIDDATTRIANRLS